MQYDANLANCLARSALVLCIACLIALSYATGARAQDDPEATTTAQVRALFEEGLALADEERWERAADRFRRAWSLRAAPVIGYNLAAALDRLGRLVDASEVLERVVRMPDAPEEVRRPASGLLEAIRPRLAHLRIRTEGDAREVIIRVGERELPTELVGMATAVDPGAHVVRAMVGEEVVATRTVEVEEGESAQVLLAIPARAPSPEEVAWANGGGGESGSALGSGSGEPEDTGSILGEWWFWTFTAAVLAGGVVAVVLLANDSDAPQPVDGTWGVVRVP